MPAKHATLGGGWGIMNVEDFIDATNTANSSNDVFLTFARVVAELGYDRIIYCDIGPTQLPAIVSNYPEEWLRHYAEKGYVRTDPARLHCAVARRPFLWDEVTRTLPKEKTLIFAEAAECGVKDGIGIAIHEPSGETKGIALASSCGGVEIIPHISRLHLIAMQFHLAYSAKNTTPCPFEYHLSPREREVLLWLSQGKSKWVIGEILAISTHAVDYHCRNIFKKLGVSSSRMAVIKAIQLGLIPLG